MAKATKLPSGSYRVQATVVIDGEKIKRSFTAPTAREAENEAYLWQTHCRMIGKDSTRMTVKEAMERYIAINEKRLSPSTVAGYKRIVNNDIPGIMNKPLYTLDCPTIQTSIYRALETLSVKTIKNKYGFLRTVLNCYHPSFIWAIKLPQKQKPKKRIYSDSYIKEIFSALKGSDFEVEAYLGVLSLRASEIGGLKWNDINFKDKTLYICRTKLKDKNNEYIIVENTKTENSARTVYIPDYVCQILKQRKATSNSEFVSLTRPEYYWKKLNRILQKNDVQGLAFHELRHIYSSVSSRLGIDTQIRMLNGGWSNEHIMNGTYRHPMSEEQEKANKKMNNYVNLVSQVTTKVTTQNRKRLKLVRFDNIV